MKQLSTTSVLSGLFVVIMLSVLSLALPLNTAYAIPPLGLTTTPTPVSTSPPSGGGDDDPTEVIQLQLGCTNLICDVSGQLVSMEIDVELINPDTGWIAAATLSNLHTSHIDVPYSGKWEVFLISPPRYSAGGGISPTGPYPQSLGTVWTNAGAQVVACPVSCTNPGPAELPETGNFLTSTFSYWPLLALFILCVVVVTLQTWYRTAKAHKTRDIL